MTKKYEIPKVKGSCEDSDSISNGFCGITTHKRESSMYEIFLNEEITSCDNYNNFISILMNAHDYDEIHIHINNFGGSLHTTIQIIQAMKLCKATIITYLDGVAMSAASLIFLSGNSLVFHDFSIMLCHSPQSSKGSNKLVDLCDNIIFELDIFTKFYKDIYTGFLTKKEINNVMNGKEMYLAGNDIRKRVKEFIKFKTKMIKKEEAKAAKKLEKKARKEIKED